MSTGLSSVLTPQNIERLDKIPNDLQSEALKKNQELGKDAFLQLMMTQLAHQDPLSPMDNAAMIDQMATFTSVEQLGSISDNMETEKQTSQDILTVLMAMMENNTNNSIGSEEKIEELITKTDQNNELNTNILNELIKLNKAMEAYDE